MTTSTPTPIPSSVPPSDVAHPLPSFLQVLVVGPIQDKIFDGRAYKSQQLECLGLDADGQPLQVGVVPLPKNLHGLIKPGIYRPSYAMRVDPKRRFMPFVSDLVPYKPAPKS